jgi:hypothetical protein
MTIFTIAAKLIINKMLETTRVTSTEADRSTTNGILSMVGFGRDLTLSKAKREQIAALLPIITELSDSLDDKVALETLQELIRKCKHDIKEQTTKYKIGTGNTEAALEGICSLLVTIYDKLKQLKLLNTPYDAENRDPLTDFKKHVAFFYAEKFTAEQHLNMVDKLIRAPMRGDKIELTEQQNTLVTLSLTTLSAHLSTLDGLIASSQQSEQQTIENQRLKCYIVAMALLTLTTKNEELCAQYQSKTGLAILNPDDGILTECLQLAQTEIGSSYELDLLSPRRSQASSMAGPAEELAPPITPKSSGSTLAVLTALQTDKRTATAAEEPISPATSAFGAAVMPLSKNQPRKMKNQNAALENKHTTSP